jgi:hypothetical protein
MINGERTFEKRETKEYPLLKNDIYQVELVDVNIEQKPDYNDPSKIEDKLSFEFAILAGKNLDGGEARLRLLAKNYVPTYLYISPKSGKNWLYKIVEALIGRDLNQEEVSKGINSKTINFLIGKQCRVLLEKQASKKDATKFYSNISNILSAEDEFTPLTSEEKDKIKEYKKAGKEKQINNALVEEHEMVEGKEIKVENIPF